MKLLMLDASCSKIIDIDEIIKDKPKILVVTKYDLCDKDTTDNILIIILEMDILLFVVT